MGVVDILAVAYTTEYVIILLYVVLQPTIEDDEQEDDDGDVDDGSESDGDELDTDMIDERDSVDDVRLGLQLSLSANLFLHMSVSVSSAKKYLTKLCLPNVFFMISRMPCLLQWAAIRVRVTC